MSPYSFIAPFLVLILSTSDCAAADGKEDPVEGTWSLHRYLADGEDTIARWNGSYSFSREKATVFAKVLTTDGFVDFINKGSVVTRPDKKPAEIDLTFRNDLGLETLTQGIYTCRKGELQIQYFTKRIGRPTVEDVQKRQGISELVLRRDEKKGKTDETGE